MRITNSFLQLAKGTLQIVAKVISYPLDPFACGILEHAMQIMF
jgi:hypothetical protein